ncbi:nucleotide pyrophosphohydrolase [Desulfallas sp. Bu1-1]|jgi:NTP pyrophosphatase (non-canonical NTP hydrolase)|uniref:nucleotide pyrophosphohydrolase n=1 Tax=Desulfallas sp. Bu1-1 TaxID=2787620 RepID=UPI0018A02463|nr:nucleotide pyrophosphohydrolase [Desulfallas sp. Bu1-1]MBF7081693.1 nucleotide pyrophosphohydrolase [Desulfallas sp. Bu1-1]
MSDKTTNIQELKDIVAAFVEERQWNQFHSPKNLSMSIAIEAAELMELFQWSNEGDIDDISMNRVREELADVVIYCLSMANALELDLTTAVKAKVIANAKKYPVDRFKGKYK